ncbi:hypothetical protein KUA55_00805 [Enterococcus sp. ALS3]|uniref:DUF5648 domain-containing protein n=1 Tax=Enterococcus alishanensis TaxID=1303817 RepID=A0ABS6T8H3_9ENTE|nr:hypothetical protein [Enterococcus alishanensis]MBV7389202.1 hypothetical protein [Enterococcus alishanensis]
MKKTVLLSLGAVIGLGLAVYGGTDASAASNELYRVYNPNSGEHFYTESASERDGLIASGWTDEGIGWNTPTSGDTVYRVYNSNAGDHHYTKSVDEYNWLAAQGWAKEGTSFYSSTTEDVAIYRAYNPNAVVGSHNFTQSSVEQNWLTGQGWTNEGIAFYGVNPTTDPEDPSNVDKTNLQGLYDLVRDFGRMDFVSDADFASFSTALSNAASVLANDDADQTAVDAAYQLLVASDKSFKSELRAAITNAEEANLVETDYPAASWADYQARLKVAKDALVNQVSEADVKTATDNLNSSVEWLQDDANKYNKATLQALLDRIEEINPQQADFAKAGYLGANRNADAWKTFQDRLAIANERVDVNNLTVTQQEINSIVNAVTNSYEGLIYLNDLEAIIPMIKAIPVGDFKAGAQTNVLALVEQYQATLNSLVNDTNIDNDNADLVDAVNALKAAVKEALTDNTMHTNITGDDVFTGKTPLTVAE